MRGPLPSPPSPLPQARAGRNTWLGLLVPLLLSLAAPSWALFGDEEARKAIVDLRDQVAQMQKDDNTRVDALSQRIDRIDNLLQAIQRGQLEAGGQFDQLQQEIGRASCRERV